MSALDILRERAARRARAAAAALFSAVLLAACGGGSGQAAAPSVPAVEQPKRSAPTEHPDKVAPCSVAYWGDSIAAMTAPRMDKRLDVELHGVVGGTAQAAQASFLQDPLLARFVVLEYGTNDSNAKVPFEPAMRAMLDWAKAAGRTPVLTGLSNATAGELVVHAVYNVQTLQLAKEYGALHADWAAVAWSPADLMADGVHPNDSYQQRLADKLVVTILAAAPECEQ